MQPTVRYIFGRLRLLSPGRDGNGGDGNGGAPKPMEHRSGGGGGGGMHMRVIRGMRLPPIGVTAA